MNQATLTTCYGTDRFGAVSVGADACIAFRFRGTRRVTAETIARRVAGRARAEGLRTGGELCYALAEVCADVRTRRQGKVPADRIEYVTTRRGEHDELCALSELATVLAGPPDVLLGMLCAARSWLRTPAGGWGETEQAWRQLTDFTWIPGDSAGSTARTAAVVRVAERWFAADAHVSRRRT